MDVGPGIEPAKSQPVSAAESKPPLVARADLDAYVAMRAHSTEDRWKDLLFQKMYSVVNPERLMWGAATQDPKWHNA